MADAYDRGFTGLIENIRTNTRPLTDEQLLMPIKVLLAIDESVRTNREVEIK